jgi:hypothetical protein
MRDSLPHLIHEENDGAKSGQIDSLSISPASGLQNSRGSTQNEPGKAAGDSWFLNTGPTGDLSAVQPDRGKPLCTDISHLIHGEHRQPVQV